MIQSITVIKSSENHELVFHNEAHKVVIDLSLVDLTDCNSFDIKIVFSKVITEFRSHNYVWEKFKTNFIANEYSSKIIKLENSQIIQANITSGIWEIDSNNTNVLLWRFNPENSAPIINYLGNENKKIIDCARQKFDFSINPTLLFPVEFAVEFSRSEIPFSAVACFTDHCDFDTAENLVLQRNFFNEHQIKITKGFFLNHFSKRQDNASYQNQAEELLEWKASGHELCYHSLSQSLKSNDESFKDFKEFIPPNDTLKVWIDHGFQPYNFSMLKKSDLKEGDFEEILRNKNINILWNYIDSGTATSGVINQFNTQDFTLLSFYKGNKDLDLVKKIQLIIKNIIFHYYNNHDLILNYRDTSSNFKKVFFQKNIKLFFPLMKDFLKLGISILAVLLFWNNKKKEIYKLAKYSPILFKHIIATEEIYIFQTLEMLDFRKSLSQENIERLINESGVFIAHTYFSVPMQYHRGRLFSTPEKIDEKVSKNFKFLGDKIKKGEIWNPTLSELIKYWSGFEKLIFDVDLQGIIFEKSNTGLKNRKAM